MLAQERHRRILQLVGAHGSVRTTDLAVSMDVTEETVRRDFAKLESDGLLVRIHGGAMRGDSNRMELPLTSRESMNLSEKRAIARRALDNIQAGDTILLDASTTAYELACLLPDISIVVLTTALKVAVELSEREAVQVVMIGGAVSKRSLSCAGRLSELSIDHYNIQKAFISCRGVDITRGLSEANEEQARLRHHIISRADRTFLLADSSKFGLKSSFFFAKLDEIGVLVTDRLPDPALAPEIASLGLELQIPQSAAS